MDSSQIRILRCLQVVIPTLLYSVPQEVFAQTTVPNSSVVGSAAPFSNPASAVVNLLLSLVVVVVLIIVLVRFLANKAKVSQRGSIQVIAAVQVAQNRSVQVLEVQGQRYLIGVGDTITLLADVSELDFTSSHTDSNEESALFDVVMRRALSNVRTRRAKVHHEEAH